jgi:hypothetical protein
MGEKYRRAIVDAESAADPPIVRWMMVELGLHADVAVNRIAR